MPDGRPAKRPQGHARPADCISIYGPPDDKQVGGAGSCRMISCRVGDWQPVGSNGIIIVQYGLIAGRVQVLSWGSDTLRCVAPASLQVMPGFELVV